MCPCPQARSTPIISVSGPQLVTHRVRSLHQVSSHVTSDQSLCTIKRLCKSLLMKYFYLSPVT